MDLKPLPGGRSGRAFEPTFPRGHSPDCPRCGVDDARELGPRYFECCGCGNGFTVRHLQAAPDDDARSDG